MSVKYKLRQINQEESALKGKYYAVAVVSNVVSMDDIAEKVQRNCTVKVSDIKAVLAEMSEVIHDELLNGSRVVIDGLGSFKVTLSTKVADTPAEWTPTKHLRSAKVNFRPETYDIRTSGTRVRQPKALMGLKLEPYKQYSIGTTATASELEEDDAVVVNDDGTVSQ